MKIAIIDPTNYVTNFGVRILANHICENGHDVQLVYMPHPGIDNEYDYPASVYDDLDALLETVDIVGISFVSNFLGQARRLSRHVKEKFDKPLVWGGVHATACPDTSLDYADVVCIGEGEESFLEYLNRYERGEDVTSIRGLGFNVNGEKIINPVWPLVEDLDRYPYQFYDLDNQYVVEGDHIVPLDFARTKQKLRTLGWYFGMDDGDYYQYLVSAGRGCPHSCAYCCNNLFKKMYKGAGKKLRWRSVDNFIGEMEEVVAKFPYINFFQIYDDDFCAWKREELLRFCKEYKKRINLPFKCNVSPTTVTEEKIAALIEAGMVSVEIGLQSASDRLNKEVYKRKIDRNVFFNAARILNQYEDLSVYYDIILDNPYEKLEDYQQTVRFLAKLPMPYELSYFSLTFFPGTELYEKAIRDGSIVDEYAEVIDKKNNTVYPEKDPYVKYLFNIASGFNSRSLPYRVLFRFMTSLPVMRLMNHTWFYKLNTLRYRFRERLSRNTTA